MACLRYARLLKMLSTRQAWADDRYKIPQNVQTFQNYWISWLYSKCPSEMQSKKYKHAYYWFSKLWKAAWKFRETFVKSKNILHNEINGRVLSITFTSAILIVLYTITLWWNSSTRRPKMNINISFCDGIRLCYHTDILSSHRATVDEYDSV